MQTYAPKNTQRYKVFGVLSLSLSILQISCKYRKKKFKIEKKNYFLSMDLRINFKN